MTMILLDTDCLTLLEWADSPPARRLNDRLSTYPVADVATSIVTFEEKMRGWLAHIASSKKMLEILKGYEKLTRQVKLFCSMPIASFDEQAAIEFQRLRKVHRRMGVMDLRIAAIALTQHATLISKNLRDFRQIPGLIVEDWTKEGNS